MKSVILYDEKFLQHEAMGYHPERSERLRGMKRRLEEVGLWAKSEVRESRPARMEELMLCHVEGYVRKVLSMMERPPGYFDSDTFFSAGSREAALGAAGGVIDLGLEVLGGQYDWGFGLVRPPGHHATRSRAMGFCIFNNVALCAAALLKEKIAERVWIFDWDVHHGNGTQEIFWTSSEVFFSSVHQWPFYPGSGSWEEIGDGRGKGLTANFPLPQGAGDAEFTSVLRDVLLPIMDDWKPQAILISAGFDAHHQDLLGGLKVTREGYMAMTRLLLDAARRHCGGKLVFALEGGYNIEAISDCCAATIEVLHGKEVETDLGRPARRYVDYLDKTKRALAPYWKGVL